MKGGEQICTHEPGCPCSLFVTLTQYRMLLGTGERVGQSATIWKQWETLPSSRKPLGGTHCGNVCFNFALLWLLMETTVGFPPLLGNNEGQRALTQTDGVFITKRVSWHWLAPGSQHVHPTHPFVSMALAFESLYTLVQLLLTLQQPLNPLQNVLPWRVVLMA